LVKFNLRLERQLTNLTAGYMISEYEFCREWGTQLLLLVLRRIFIISQFVLRFSMKNNAKMDHDVIDNVHN